MVVWGRDGCGALKQAREMQCFEMADEPPEITEWSTNADTSSSPEGLLLLVFFSPPLTPTPVGGGC